MFLESSIQDEQWSLRFGWPRFAEKKKTISTKDGAWIGAELGNKSLIYNVLIFIASLPHPASCAKIFSMVSNVYTSTRTAL